MNHTLDRNEKPPVLSEYDVLYIAIKTKIRYYQRKAAGIVESDQ
jgi:hypothetical protein